MSDDFPNLAPGILDNLRIVARRVATQPGYLDQIGCPYEIGTKRWLMAHFGPKAEVVPEAVAEKLTLEEVQADIKNPETWGDSALKSRQLYADLEFLEVNADLDTKITIIKTKASLLERLNAVGEKALGYRKQAEFVKVIARIMDETMSPDQRTTVMHLLEEYL